MEKFDGATFYSTKFRAFDTMQAAFDFYFAYRYVASTEPRHVKMTLFRRNTTQNWEGRNGLVTAISW